MIKIGGQLPRCVLKYLAFEKIFARKIPMTESFLCKIADCGPRHWLYCIKCLRVAAKEKLFSGLALEFQIKFLQLLRRVLLMLQLRRDFYLEGTHQWAWSKDLLQLVPSWQWKLDGIVLEIYLGSQIALITRVFGQWISCFSKTAPTTDFC